MPARAHGSAVKTARVYERQWIVEDVRIPVVPLARKRRGDDRIGGDKARNLRIVEAPLHVDEAWIVGCVFGDVVVGLVEREASAHVARACGGACAEGVVLELLDVALL